MITTDTDIVVIGAGAAGLAAAIFAARHASSLRIAVLDGARTPGAKILVSGGARCNVTNAVVVESDFNGGRPAIIRQVLRAFPASSAAAFFRDLGVPLHEEALGKLFPDSNRSRDVLHALLNEVSRLGIALRAEHRVHEITHELEGFRVQTSAGTITARVVVLATGGLSLPKTGSDGAGYGFATRLGHTIVPTTPALVPLLVDRHAPRQFHAEVSGVAQPARVTVRAGATPATHIDGSLLWTHFGISGPAALDASRHWLRARLDGETTEVSVSLLPDERFESLEASWIDLTQRQSKMLVQSVLSQALPDSIAQCVATQLEISARQTLADFTRDARRNAIHALLSWPLAVTDSRGYAFAEVTAGGVTLPEIDPRTMASRVCAGLYLVGEILDVDGRLGGFNFQWAWSSAKVAGDAVAMALGR